MDGVEQEEGVVGLQGEDFDRPVGGAGHVDEPVGAAGQAVGELEVLPDVEAGRGRGGAALAFARGGAVRHRAPADDGLELLAPPELHAVVVGHQERAVGAGQRGGPVRRPDGGRCDGAQVCHLVVSALEREHLDGGVGAHFARGEGGPVVRRHVGEEEVDGGVVDGLAREPDGVEESVAARAVGASGGDGAVGEELVGAEGVDVDGEELASCGAPPGFVQMGDRWVPRHPGSGAGAGGVESAVLLIEPEVLAGFQLRVLDALARVGEFVDGLDNATYAQAGGEDVFDQELVDGGRPGDHRAVVCDVGYGGHRGDSGVE